MAESIRTIRAILDASFTADRRLTIALAALAVAGWVVIPFQAVAIKLFVDAIVGRDAQLGAIATVATGVTMGGLWYFNNLRGFVRILVAIGGHMAVGAVDGDAVVRRVEPVDRRVEH